MPRTRRVKETIGRAYTHKRYPSAGLARTDRAQPRRKSGLRRALLQGRPVRNQIHASKAKEPQKQPSGSDQNAEIQGAHASVTLSAKASPTSGYSASACAAGIA